MSPRWMRKLTRRSGGSSATHSIGSGGSGGEEKKGWHWDEMKGENGPLATSSAPTTQSEAVGPDHYVLFTERFRVQTHQPKEEAHEGRIRLHALPGTDGTRFSPSQLGIDFTLDNQIIVDPSRSYGGEPNPHFVFPSAACPEVEGETMLYGTLDLPDERRRLLHQCRSTPSGGRAGWVMLGRPAKEEGDIVTRAKDHGPGFTEVSVHHGTFDCFREGKYLIPGPSGIDEELKPAEEYNTGTKPLEQASYSSQIIDSDPEKKFWPKHKLLSDECPTNLDPDTLLTYFDGEMTKAYISHDPRVSGLHGYSIPCAHASQPEYTFTKRLGKKNLSCGEAGCSTIALHYALKLSHAEFIRATTTAYDQTGGWQNEAEPHNDRPAAFVKESSAREGKWRTEEVTLPGFDPTSREWKLIQPIKVSPGSGSLAQGFSLVGKKIENVFGGWAGESSGTEAVIRFTQNGQKLDDGSTLVCAYSGRLPYQADREGKEGTLRLEKGEVISEVDEGGHRSYWLRQGNWLVSATSADGSSGLSSGSEWSDHPHRSKGKGGAAIAKDTQVDGETVLALSSDPSVRSFRIKNLDDKIKILHGYQKPGTEEWNMRYFLLNGSGLDRAATGEESKMTKGASKGDEDPPAYTA